MMINKHLVLRGSVGMGLTKRWKAIALLLLMLALITTGVLIASPQYQNAHAAAAASAGGWPTYLFDNGRSSFNGAETQINPASAHNLKVHWTFKAGNSISSQAVVANGLIYWGSWDGYEHATRPDGTQVWQRFLGQTVDNSCAPTTVGIASTATIASVRIGGKLTPVDFVGGGKADFYALNANTGTVIWRMQLGSTPSSFTWSSPALYNGSIYIGLASYGDCPLIRGEMIKLNASTGALQNVFYTVPKECKSGGVWGSPTIDTVDGAVYFATGNGACRLAPEPYAVALVKLHASDLSYVSSWQVPPSQITQNPDFGNTPTLFQATVGGTLHKLVGIANKNGLYYAFDRTNLAKGPIWTTKISIPGGCPECGQGSISSSAWDGKALYVAGGNTSIGGKSCQGGLRALNPSTGAFLWQDCFTDGPILAAVSAVPGVVMVDEGSFLVVAATTGGSTLFTYKGGASFNSAAPNVNFGGTRFYSPPSVANGVLYVGNMNGTLYALGL